MEISAFTLLRNPSSWYLKHSMVIFASQVFVWLLVVVIFICIVYMYNYATMQTIVRFLCRNKYKSIYLIISGKGFRLNRDLQSSCLMRLLYFDRFLNITYTMQFDQKRNK